jgi:hypothetical protein
MGIASEIEEAARALGKLEDAARDGNRPTRHLQGVVCLVLVDGYELREFQIRPRCFQRTEQLDYYGHKVSAVVPNQENRYLDDLKPVRDG